MCFKHRYIHFIKYKICYLTFSGLEEPDVIYFRRYTNSTESKWYLRSNSKNLIYKSWHDLGNLGIYGGDIWMWTEKITNDYKATASKGTKGIYTCCVFSAPIWQNSDLLTTETYLWLSIAMAAGILIVAVRLPIPEFCIFSSAWLCQQS